MGTLKPSSMRVLIRAPNSTAPQPARSSPPPPPPSSTATVIPTVPISAPSDLYALPPLPPPPAANLPPSPRSSSPPPLSGVVVVGFISRRYGDLPQIINRIVDSNVFGSGNLDKKFGVEKEGIGEDVKNWFSCRKISYYHDDEKGILYLQFSSNGCPVMEGYLGSSTGLDSVLEDLEFGDLQGMLFMFSVCHVIIFIQEGSRLDTQILKQFRILQAAKHAMIPIMRSRTSVSTSNPSLSSRTAVSGTSSNHPSHGKNGGILSRNASQISLMSGLGSYTSLFPGQCTPVTLFIFVDDLTDVSSGSSTEETVETSSLNQSSSLSAAARPGLPMKGSSPVVVLARPSNKSEGGFRKKLQSSLEAQLRFSIKKCRTLTGFETSHSGSRSGGVSNSAPLFSLDASKAVALLDRSTNQRGESLDFATGIVDEVLSGKANSDSLLLETHIQSANKEDILSVKEFIYRQSDVLRGRGGLVSNTNSASAGGVGMVAVAAAAAAASAASGKALTAPELPSLEIWLSSSQLILHGILSAKCGHMVEPETSKRKPRQFNAVATLGEDTAGTITNSLDIAISCLESGRGLSSKFSTLWCQRVLPAAKDVYLKELPDCYPTLQHEAHLEKALCAFYSMVKGPAVPFFIKKLEDECTTIWKSGRQLCDAVSLTGKPCMHQKHDVDAVDLISRDGVKQHCSGFVFLHACACGRSRKLCLDPFDYVTANNTNCFLDCDKLLPTVQLPQLSNTGPIQASSWSLIRVGGAKYYEPSKGLLQSGFYVTQKFLLKWTIFIDSQKYLSGSPKGTGQKVHVNKLSIEPKTEPPVVPETKKYGASQLSMEEMQIGVEIQRKPSSENVISDDKKASAGRGIPNLKMRKPFSEVVAGSAAADSGFPPLQSRKQPLVGPQRGSKPSSIRDRGSEQVHEASNNQGSQKSEDISAVQETGNGKGIGVNEGIDRNHFLQIGGNMVPVSMTGGEKSKLNTSIKHAIIYVGFEHECPCGHRFVLTPEHLNELGSQYSLPKEVHTQSSVENLGMKVSHPTKVGKNGAPNKAHRHSNGVIASSISKLKKFEKSKETAAKSKQYVEGLMQSPRLVEQSQGYIGMSQLPASVKDLDAGFQSFTLDDGESAFTLLNRNIPIYMNCPHCKTSKSQKDAPEIKFASTMSQLQRIFLVTPPFPVILAACPVVQFEQSCLPPSVPNREQKLQFSLGCEVVLPSESFLSFRLPFVYGVQLEDGSTCSLRPFEHQPEMTAWIMKGTTLQVISKVSSLDEGLHK